MATDWVPDLPILKAFLNSFGIPKMVQMVFHMLDPASIEISYLKFGACFATRGWGLERSELSWEHNFL